MLLEFLWKWEWMGVGKNSPHSLEELKKKKKKTRRLKLPNIKTYNCTKIKTEVQKDF